PGGGGAGSGGAAPAGSAAGADDAAKKSTGEVGGFTFTDKPAAAAAAAPRRAPAVRRAGALATFPGFEQLGDGGTRLFVQLSQNVPVEERRAQGSVTYVLKGAHLRVHNDANALVTVHFNTPVYRARLTPSGNDLLFVLELRSAATPTFKLQDNADKTSTLVIDFAKGDFLDADGSGSLPPETAPARGAKRAGKRAPASSSGASGGASGTNPGPTP
ncbi:MAG: hypothetical protein JWP97_398, partial [Labilithrix sp.]|nr:hypothetical protein [Labilithrix sp.]